VKILFVASEATPLVKVGGLADVVGSLPKALCDLGHDVRIMIPDYSIINSHEYVLVNVLKDIIVPPADLKFAVTVKEVTVDNAMRYYLVDNSRFFQSDEIYGEHEIERFFFFCRAGVSALSYIDWKPDIVHCHDWHSALVPLLLKKENFPAASLFTIHNLVYQGWLNKDNLADNDVMQYWEYLDQNIPEPLHNFMSLGVLWADMISTVSEQYAQEILTVDYGAGMDHLLKYRQNELTGILNGIDYEEYNPAHDPLIPANFTSTTLIKRIENKYALQKKVGIPPEEKTPVIGMVSRLDEQKGFNIMLEMLDRLLSSIECQLVILGKGLESYQYMLNKVSSRYPDKFKLVIGFDETLARLIYAGSDLFLMPSRFEPCGLGQMIAMRYGAVPVVRHTGGLVDTVEELAPDLSTGSGFVFENYDGSSLYNVLERAIRTCTASQNDWQKVIARVMQHDFSWKRSAAKYETVYRNILNSRGYSKNEG
jgi:starch synthase